MPDTPPTPPMPPDAQPSVDALTPAVPASAPKATPAPASPVVPLDALARAKKKLLLSLGVFYGVFILWSGVLVVLLPSTDGRLQSLMSIGLLSILLGVVIFLGLGMLAFQRITKADVSIARRKQSLIKVIALIVPGVLISAGVAYLITREPGLPIDITYPTRAEDFVAPLAVTLSAEQATEILRNLGDKAVMYRWDYDGDGQLNEETALPVTTALYDRQGVYTVSLRIVLDDGSTRKLTRRITIPRAVFSLSPYSPIVEKPVRFSVSHLIPDSKQLVDVSWDFDGDGNPEEVSKMTDTVHTFYTTGRVTVTAVIRMLNQTQGTYQRVIEVSEQPPLPFPVSLIVEPKNLIGPVPFGALFRIETNEPIKEVVWNFGDEKEERGSDLRRVGHSYEEPGIYPVTVKIRSASGFLAEITTIVRATQKLELADLRFAGSPDVKANKVAGEVPLRVQLTPQTNVPLVQFAWEAPDASVVSITGSSLAAIYRREGTYTLTLLAQDPEGRAVRIPITVEAQSPSAQPSIRMSPEGGTAPLRVRFDASETFVPAGEDVAGFAWLFGDEARNEPPEPGAAQVEHVYNAAGEYTVILTVIMQSGKEYTTRRSVIVRRPTLDACLTVSRLTVSVGGGIEFDSSCSTGAPVSLLWDVRYDVQPDRVLAQSEESRYIHVFEEAGTYTISLTIRDQFNNEDKDSVTITVTP